MQHSPIPAPSVLAGVKLALKPHAPFSAMSERDLERIVRASQLRYFAPGETILAPASERPAHCYVIRQGTVRGERPGGSGDARRHCGSCPPGEMFPLGALLARRGVTSVYRATQDTFCLAFPVAVFDALIGRVAGLPGLLHAPARAPARPVAGAACRPSTRRPRPSSAGSRRELGSLVRQAPIVLRPRRRSSATR